MPSVMTSRCLDVHDQELSFPRLQWRPEPVSSESPPERCKHAAAVGSNGELFICGGRSGLQPLKDLWRFDPGKRRWRRLAVDGSCDFPALEGHSLVTHGEKLLIFGGTFGYPDACETPLWIYNLPFQLCRQWLPHGEVAIPSSRRGHSAVVYRDAMYVFGGFVDLRGSVAELWCFDIPTESWHLVWSPTTHSGSGPSPRHGHSAILHDSALWIFGGMNDLATKGDLWRWSFRIGQWSRIKYNRGPGSFANHSATMIDNRMLVISNNSSTCSSPHTKTYLWAFSFDFYCWQDLSDSSSPSLAHVCCGQTLHVVDFPIVSSSSRRVVPHCSKPFFSPPPSSRPSRTASSLTPVSFPSDDLCVLEDLELRGLLPPDTDSVYWSAHCPSVVSGSYRRLSEDEGQQEGVPSENPVSRWAYRNAALSVSSIDSATDSGLGLVTSDESTAPSLRASGRQSSRCGRNEVRKRTRLVLVGCCKRSPVPAPLVMWCADIGLPGNA